jgi:hypothetical protein
MRGQMEKENLLRDMVERLNAEFKLSEEFKSRVLSLIEKLDGCPLGPEQVQMLASKVRETYQRQVLIEACRDESLKSLEKIQLSLNAYSNALNEINQRLNQAEMALERLAGLKSKTVEAPQPPENKGITPYDKQKAKAIIAFVSLDSKGERIN